MCGIIASIGKENNSFFYCLSGLKQLQNRGYDSAGICSITDKQFITTKYASIDKESALVKVEGEKEKHNNACVSIGHTRWATHGAKTDINSHPHISSDGLFSLVHNGIIENYAQLKEMLIKNGFTFRSQTDSEVVVNLISYFYKIHRNNTTMAIQKTISKLQGTWGLAITCVNEPEKLYATRHGSPILIGHTDGLAIVTSEQSGFCNQVNNYFILQNMDICVIELKGNKIDVYTNELYQVKEITKDDYATSPHPWPHWTIKEIHEQTESCLRAISLGGRLCSDNTVKLGGLETNKTELMRINHLILLGCGTSYHAGMFGVNYFKDLSGFDTVQLFDGAEFNEKDIPRRGKTALVLLSQSGETKDLHRCIQIGKENDLLLIGVVNVVDSLIAREVHCGCYLNAGREVAVASTKSYTSQIIVLNLMALWFAQEKSLFLYKRQQYIQDLHNLHIDIKKTVEMCETKINNVISLFNYQSCFLLGKGSGESIAREGALKIKEISYIHAEGYSTSSLKHGPFALLTKNFPVILIAPDNEHYTKSENAYEEIKSRHANIVFITDKEGVEKENTIMIKKNRSFQDLLSIIPLQILAYKLSLARDLNPDMPRNLAKVVTVE
jgi:glucosamine--fructose-6-phosphate aminotransferase (isomerizing)